MKTKEQVTIEELEAELRTRDNAEATHRITLREVQAETMRVQAQCDALVAALTLATTYHEKKCDCAGCKALAKVRLT